MYNIFKRKQRTEEELAFIELLTDIKKFIKKHSVYKLNYTHAYSNDKIILSFCYKSAQFKLSKEFRSQFIYVQVSYDYCVSFYNDLKINELIEYIFNKIHADYRQKIDNSNKLELEDTKQTFFKKIFNTLKRNRG